jgi:single-stranded-DNA-specific exonuclease
MTARIGDKEIEIPIPDLRMRKRSSAVFEKMMDRGESFLVSVLSANRITDVSQSAYKALHMPSMRTLDMWRLKDIEKAVERIIVAKERGERVGLVTDFDVDGISSAVVMFRALTEHLGFEESQIVLYVNNRMEYGYGFNDKVLDRVMSTEDTPTLLITADQGSNDNKRVVLFKDKMASKGIDYADVIVTDHHHINVGETCGDAAAFVNPQRHDCEFEDKTICGCMVALLLMAASHRTFVERNLIPSDTPSVQHLLTYASLATVADCVSLASEYNRFIVKKGLNDINQGVIPAWQVLMENRYKSNSQITSRDLAFLLGPAINADSRTGGDGSDALNFLMAKNLDDARGAYAALTKRNNRRKDIELSMVEVALEDASEQYYSRGFKGISIYLPKGSHGIHGIVASRVKEKFQCPVIVFSPVDLNEKDHAKRELTASGRSIDHIDIHTIMTKIKEEMPIEFGGHPMALGVKKLTKDLFSEFQEKFNKYVLEAGAERVGSDAVKDFFYPFVEVDHLIQENELKWLRDVNTLGEISKLEPYGQRFELPIFAINGVFVGSKRFGKTNAHLNIMFQDSMGNDHVATLFNYERASFVSQLVVGNLFTFSFKMEYDSYKKAIGLQIESIAKGMNNLKTVR